MLLDRTNRSDLFHFISNKMRGKNQNGYQYSRDSNLTRSSKDFGRYVCYMTSSSDEISADISSEEDVM